jgi:tetratricopeptide (TPR) repeat protein
MSYVNVWEEEVIIPTYAVGEPDKNPMFFEKRIYQGSSGVVYPNPVIEKIFDEKVDKAYHAVFLENEFIKIMILPELGGRIQMAYDKIKERHFIYYNQVIKPALVGLTGPWISGGIEFNWPQHHRPSTFDPIDFKLQDNEDGSKTVWVNEIEQMFHTKGMAEFTLHPGKAYIEIKAKLLNRSNLPQTFLWWANPAVKVNDFYQSVFPPDVNAVFDHGKRDVSTFPIATGTYYKVDYSPGTDISMYKNIPVPTSYMAINSDYDFVGGYEHDTQGGLLHVANHHVSPGKKQWTWGHSDFGKAWDRNLTDEDGPYIELMTGMFTDNQPDFTWILPNEEKSFTQYFLPYKDLGLVKNATKDILVSLEVVAKKIAVKIYVTSIQKSLTISLVFGDQCLLKETQTISPNTTYSKNILLDQAFKEKDLLLIVSSPAGKELIRYEPGASVAKDFPEPAKAAITPKSTENVEQLFLTGQHLEQYRHATYSPVPYYEEGLSRDPKDFRCNNALGLWYLRRGQFSKSEQFFRTAVSTVTERNPNPYDTEPYYNLGLALKYQEDFDGAYKAFYKATWGKAYKDSAYFQVAQIDLIKGDYEVALEHLQHAVDNNANNSKLYVLQAACLRKLGFQKKAISMVRFSIERDPFNLGAYYELSLSLRLDGFISEGNLAIDELVKLSRVADQNFITYAIDYAAAGLYKEAIDFLTICVNAKKLSGASVNPLLYYYLGAYSCLEGNTISAQQFFKAAELSNSYSCFPNRLEDIPVLKLAIKINPHDSKAPYYLGNLYYDKRQYDEAISYWGIASELDKTFPTTFRNLGIAYFNKRNNPEKALAFFEHAFQLDVKDARVVMELDQLYKRVGYTAEKRLKFLEANMAIVESRDDVYLEYISLLSYSGSYEQALSLLINRQFHPWEGGEGKASGQYLLLLIEKAKKSVVDQDYRNAIQMLEKAQSYPHSLGEGKLYGAQENDIYYWMGIAFKLLGDDVEATAYFTKATVGLDEPSAAVFYNDQQPDKIFYQGLAYLQLGNEKKAHSIFNKLIAYADAHLNDRIVIDYFAVSLPNLLVFEDDLEARNRTHCYFMKGLGALGLGEKELAVDAFLNVLSIDPTHTGAKIHMNMPI